MTIKEKILTFLEEMGIKKADFFESLGIAPSNFKGAAKYNELGGDKIVRILTECPALSAEWLMRDKGAMLIPSEEDSQKKDKTSTTIPATETHSPTIDKLLDRLDQREKVIGDLREEIGKLKATIEMLENGKSPKNILSHAHSMKPETVET